MYYLVDSDKSFEQAAADLDVAVKANGFGVLYVHDLGNTFRTKGIDFAEECRVFEICNPNIASKVLAIDLRLNMALPCRISIYTEKGKTKIGLIKPTGILSALSQEQALVEIGQGVEATLIKMVDEAK